VEAPTSVIPRTQPLGSAFPPIHGLTFTRSASKPRSSQVSRQASKSEMRWRETGIPMLAIGQEPLHPGSSSTRSTLHRPWVNCTDGKTQGGHAQLHGGGDRPVLWFGSRDSVLDMSPKGYIGGSITGLAGNMQVGHGQTSQTSHAGLWRGTPDSFVDLHPQEATWSEASATDGVQQVGVGIALTDNAYLWQALLWNGTAESCVFLRPQGATNSFASGVWGGFQVGSAEFNRKATASIWSGTPESWFDLGQFAPPEFTSTGAHSIWSDGKFMYVVGGGWNSDTETREALLWSRPIPAPSALPPCVAIAAIAHRRRRPIS
jgi:hypothetical protein